MTDSTSIQDREGADRELLELAAKAAGIEIAFDSMGAYIVCPGISGSDQRWNPLTDDGDALRLAVRLEIVVVSHASSSMADNQHEEHKGDSYAATRRAIVRAAAALAQFGEAA